MKNLTLTLALLAIITTFSSCKKTTSDNTVTPAAPVAPDPYAGITVNQTQQSLVMLGSATWCPDCGEWGDPDFYTAIEGKTNSDITTAIDTTRINALELHTTNSPTDPLYNLLSVNLSNALGDGGLTSMPDVWADFLNSYSNPREWNMTITQTQAKTDPYCALGISKVKNGSSYTVYVKIEFYKTVGFSDSGTYSIAVYAVEDNVVAAQNTPSGEVSDFVHHNVLRNEITANNPNVPLGTPFVTAGTPKSQYTFTYTYKVPTGENIDNIKFVGVIYKMYQTEIWNSPNSNTTR